MLVDVDVARAELVRLSRGLTPARLARVIAMLDPVELMFALKKLRARRAPANQAHVTNLKENPALLAADAAEAAARGFAEIETTVGVSRYAPLNAIAILVGSQTGRPGVLTQCAVEERLNLRLAIQGLVTYAETLSVYGTEPVFVDGDDTPWSKAFLASAYASRGVKVRFTSGGGSEALMGESEGKSMLYLEARCLAARSRGGLAGRPERLDLVRRARARRPRRHARDPRGERARRLARPRGRLGQRRDLEPLGDPQDGEADGAVPARERTSSRPGYSAMPRYDNMFGGGNYDSDDLDEWLTIQRDWQVDAGIEPLAEAEALAVRERGARAVQAVFDAFGFPPITDEEVRLATTCLDSRDLPDRDRAADVAAADRVLAEGLSALDVARALDERGFPDVRGGGLRACSGSASRPTTSRPRRSSRRDGTSSRPSTTPNVYTGPGHRLPARGRALGAPAAAARTRSTRACSARSGDDRAVGRGASPLPIQATDRDEVVIAVGPAFGGALPRRSTACRTGTCSRRSSAGVREEGATAAHRPRQALLRRRLHRPRRRAALRLGHRRRPPVEGHGADPPRRPRAARQPRAVRDGAVADARVVPPDRPQRGRLRARPRRRARCRRCWTTSRARS